MSNSRLLVVVPEFHPKTLLEISLSLVIRFIAKNVFSRKDICPRWLRFERRSVLCMRAVSPHHSSLFLHCGKSMSYAVTIADNMLVRQPEHLQEKFLFQSFLARTFISQKLKDDLLAAFPGAATLDAATVEHVLSHICFVRAAPSTWNPSDEDASFFGIPFTIGGRTVNLVKERTKCCEALFDCDKSSACAGIPMHSLPTLCKNAVSSAKSARPGKAEAEYYGNIVLSGCGLDFKGIERRLKRELRGSVVGAGSARSISGKRISSAGMLSSRVRVLAPPPDETARSRATIRFTDVAFRAGCRLCQGHITHAPGGERGAGRWICEGVYRQAGLGAIFSIR